MDILLAPPVGAKPRPVARGAEAHPRDQAEAQQRALRALPFSPADVTAGCENELQAAVCGPADAVDLPRTIRESSYFENLERRVRAGDACPRALEAIRRVLEENRDGVWENSWVRFPMGRLNEKARCLLHSDLRADKRLPDGPPRGDVHRFVMPGGDPVVRIPVSYLLRLSLHQFLGEAREPALAGAEALGDHFLSDNTSPETFSFRVVAGGMGTGPGRALAAESAIRFLYGHLLLGYGNEALGLAASGQRATTFAAPLPPHRQRLVNEAVSGAFYRELYMSPCLSGWDEGEAKHQYMHLCHQVLSWSQLTAVAKLREAGIVANNLVVPPSLSNISLANNGVHVTLGSRALTELRRDPANGFDAAEEKRLGDLVTKVVEHFLPLLVGTYSAAPRRIDFEDFHPEKVLGFLPHELDFTHLRPLWRRWRRKARNGFLGHALTPFGPRGLDRALAMVLRLRGDLVPDMRLIDYLVAPMSTPGSPALDGTLGNTDRLRADLADMGVFHRSMAFYALYRQRHFDRMGFCGFEGRTHSTFERFAGDFAPATDLQALLTAYAVRLVLSGAVTHADVPDTPEAESERRQFFFAAAIGLNTANVARATPNRFLARFLEKAAGVKPSRRYGDRLKVKLPFHRLALVAALREDAPDLVEAFGAGALLEDLEARLQDPALSAAGRLTRAIADTAGVRDPFRLSAAEFDVAADHYYRERLREQHLRAGLDLLAEEAARPGPRLAALGLADPVAALRSSGHAVLGRSSAPQASHQLLSIATAIILDGAPTPACGSTR